MTRTALEIAFCRLLLKCQAHVTTDPLAIPVIKLRIYVDYLQEQLLDLENDEDTRPPIETLQSYRRKLMRLQRLVDSMQPNVVSLPPEDLPGYVPPPTAAGTEALPGKILGPGTQPASNGSMVARNTRDTIGSATDKGSMDKQFRLTEYSKQQVNVQKEIQDELVNEMVDFAGQLKANAQAMSSHLRQRRKAVDDAAVELDASATQAKKSSAGVKALKKKYRRNFCQTLMVLFFVGVVFVMMYMFIQTTRYAAWMVPTYKE